MGTTRENLKDRGKRPYCQTIPEVPLLKNSYEKNIVS